MTRLALVSFGNEESYGLIFAASELKKHGEIKFFDAEFSDSLIDNIIAFSPSYICFSPMTCFYPQAKKIELEVKEKMPNVVSIYGGHHASNSGKNLGFMVLTCLSVAWFMVERLNLRTLFGRRERNTIEIYPECERGIEK